MAAERALVPDKADVESTIDYADCQRPMGKMSLYDNDNPEYDNGKFVNAKPDVPGWQDYDVPELDK